MTKEDPSSEPIMIREVWAHNLHEEFNLIRGFVGTYNFISMDTEFPGVIFPLKVDHHHLQPYEQYSYLKANVDALNIIQIGLTLTDAKGNLPRFKNIRCIWEFNFCDFNIERDPHNKDSIDMLRCQGIDFVRNASHGVNSLHFCHLMRGSGLLINEDVTWVTFHSAFDFAYLVKIITQSYLPNSLENFLKVLRKLFGSKVYDMKYIIRYCSALHGGLERVANILDVDRAVGKSHQAGSDSLLTWQTFQKMVHTHFINNEVQKYAGIIFGLEVKA